MEQVAAVEVDLAAQVEVDRGRGHRRRQAEAALSAARSRASGAVATVRHGSELGADDEPLRDERERDARTEGQDRPDRLVHLVEPGRAPAAERGGRLGQSGGLDEVRRGDVEAVVAEEAGDTDQPGLDERTAALPEVPIPARRGDARAVARRHREVLLAPGNPGRLDRGRGRPFEQRGVGAASARSDERRDVVGAADDGDLLRALRFGGPDRVAHGGLAEAVEPGRLDALAQLGHEQGDGFEDLGRVVAVLDETVPPALAVLADRPAQGADRVEPERDVAEQDVLVGRGGVVARRRARPPVSAVAGSASAAWAAATSSASSVRSSSSRTARALPSGRSAKRTGVPRSAAKRIACHSGENVANG